MIDQIRKVELIKKFHIKFKKYVKGCVSIRIIDQYSKEIEEEYTGECQPIEKNSKEFTSFILLRNVNTILETYLHEIGHHMHWQREVYLNTEAAEEYFAEYFKWLILTNATIAEVEANRYVKFRFYDGKPFSVPYNISNYFKWNSPEGIQTAVSTIPYLLSMRKITQEFIKNNVEFIQTREKYDI